MGTKTMVVAYNEDDWDAAIPLASSPLTRESFEFFYTLAADLGINVFRASTDWFDSEKNTFAKGWTYRDNHWEKIDSPIAPNIVFDKIAGKYDYPLFALKEKSARNVKWFNSPLFRVSFDNKFSQYLALSEYMPESFLAENARQLSESLRKICSEKAVLKPIYGSGGEGVLIGSKTELLNHDALAFPLLVQEFIPTAGIPGFSPAGAVADLRLIYINNKLECALSRIAGGESLHTNLHQGASAVIVPYENIPQNCLSAAEKIVNKLSIFPNTNYSLDFFFDLSGAPILIEMNTTPGFDLLLLVGTKQLVKDYFTKLILAIAE